MLFFPVGWYVAGAVVEAAFCELDLVVEDEEENLTVDVVKLDETVSRVLLELLVYLEINVEVEVESFSEAIKVEVLEVDVEVLVDEVEVLEVVVGTAAEARHSSAFTARNDLMATMFGSFVNSLCRYARQLTKKREVKERKRPKQLHMEGEE